VNFHDLRGRQVLDVGSAQELGTIDDLYVRLSSQEVVGLRVRGGGLFAEHRA